MRGREALYNVWWGSLTGRVDHSIGKYVGIAFMIRESQRRDGWSLRYSWHLHAKSTKFRVSAPSPHH